MCNKERLVAYLYDDLKAIERTEFEAHLAGCAACREELGELRRTRRHLAEWAPPEPEFNFQIVRGAPAVPAAPAPRFSGVPRWALAAAAALVLLAGAAAIARFEVRYEADGSLVVRTGWGGAAIETAPVVPTGAAAPTAAVRPASEDAEQLKAAVVALTARVRELEQARPTQLAPVSGAAKPGVTIAELRKILAESESRQRTELAVQIGHVLQDVKAARVSDFNRMQEVLGRAQGLTNYQLKQHRDSIESLSYRVASTQPR